MPTRLTNKTIRYAVRQLEKGKYTKTVAEEINVTQRHVQRLWAEFNRTGSIHVQQPAGRPADLPPSDEEINMVLDVHGRKPEGVLRTARRLRKEGHGISYSRVYQIMKPNGLSSTPRQSRGGASGSDTSACTLMPCGILTGM